MHREVSLPQPLHDTLDRLSRHDRVLGALLMTLRVGAKRHRLTCERRVHPGE
jgi:hypothetical protein